MCTGKGKIPVVFATLMEFYKLRSSESYFLLISPGCSTNDCRRTRSLSINAAAAAAAEMIIETRKSMVEAPRRKKF